MHRLVTAENFDENAARTGRKMANEQIAHQVEMAKVRNQMYRPVNAGAASGFKREHQRMRAVARRRNGKKVHR